jgi:hypothetical protein
VKKENELGSWEATLFSLLDGSWIPPFIKFRSPPPPKKIEPFSQEMHLKIMLLSRGLKLPNPKPCYRVSALYFFFLNRYHQWLSDIELIQISASSASYCRINPCCTAGRRIGVRNCHATRGHRKTTVFTSIVYGSECVFPEGWTLVKSDMERTAVLTIEKSDGEV